MKGQVTAWVLLLGACAGGAERPTGGSEAGLSLATIGVPGVGEAPPWPSPPEAAASSPEAAALAAASHLREAAARIARELDCTSSGWRFLCPATRLAGPGAPPPTLPEGRFARHGLVFNLRASDPVELAAERTTSVGVLLLQAGADGKPTAGMDIYLARGGNRVLTDVAGTVAGYIKGQFPDIVLLPSSLPLLHRTPADQSPLTQDAEGWVWTAEWPTRLMRVEDLGNGTPAWIVWRDLPGGGFLGVFPDLEAQVVEAPGAPSRPASSFPVVDPGPALPPDPPRPPEGFAPEERP